MAFLLKRSLNVGVRAVRSSASMSNILLKAFYSQAQVGKTFYTSVGYLSYKFDTKGYSMNYGYLYEPG